MYKSALLINVKHDSLPDKYFQILKDCVEEINFANADDSDLINKLKNVDLILTGYSDITKEMIDAAPNLKYIGAVSTAYEYIDMKTANEKNIIVTNLGGYSKDSVAEFVFAAILEQFRELQKARAQVKDNNFDYIPFMGIELKRKKIGVLGAGRIGSRICEIALGFGMEVNYFATTSKPELENKGAHKKDLDSILKQSDIIAVTLPLNEATTELIEIEELQLLKENCFIVNMSPLEIFNQTQLINHLENNSKQKYVIVHTDEFASDDYKNYKSLENIILYPNIAFRTVESTDARWNILVNNVKDSLNNIKSNVVSN